MKQKLHKELKVLLDFFLAQRREPPAEFSHASGLISSPSFFSVKDLQQHLNNPLLSPDWVHLRQGGQTIPLESHTLYKIIQTKELKFMDKELINRELADGAAVVLEGLDILDPSINAFLAKIDEALPCALVNSVAFFSQQDNEAYAGHCDCDDVLVVQLSGKKHWEIFEPQQRRYMDNDSLSDARLGPVKHKLTMRPGDAMYLRAGVPHRCQTPGDHSLHLAFDLCDRTPNIEFISNEANTLYNHACEDPYVPATDLIKKYIKFLQMPEFQAEVEATTQQFKSETRGFRDRIGRASGVRALSKYF